MREKWNDRCVNCNKKKNRAMFENEIKRNWNNNEIRKKKTLFFERQRIFIIHCRAKTIKILFTLASWNEVLEKERMKTKTTLISIEIYWMQNKLFSKWYTLSSIRITKETFERKTKTTATNASRLFTYFQHLSQ